MTIRTGSTVIGLLFAVTSMLVAAGAQTLGVAPSLKNATPIKDVVAKPTAYEGKTVRLEGIVTAVCQEMGRWMALASPDDPKGPTVRFKVEDGVIVFPVTARGRRATAQGVVQRITMDDHHGRAAAEEHAHEEHRQPAPAGAEIWQIKATGAVIY